MAKPKKSLVNLSLDSDFVEVLKAQATERKFDKLSDYVQDWLKKLSLERSDIKRVILQIPPGALVNKESLGLWLKNRSSEIVNHYFKESDAK
jgi:hypothetical protein